MVSFGLFVFLAQHLLTFFGGRWIETGGLPRQVVAVKRSPRRRAGANLGTMTGRPDKPGLPSISEAASQRARCRSHHQLRSFFSKEDFPMKRMYLNVTIAAMVLLALLVCAVPAGAADTKGKIEAINLDKMTFNCKAENKQEFSFHMTPTSKVRIAGKDGKLADLKVGDEVTVSYEVKENLNNVILVERK
jgi:hypothetical protein